MSTAKSRALLEKVQRLVCVCITGAMKTTPTRALEQLCGLGPLHLFIPKEAARAAHRLAGLNMLITDSAESWVRLGDWGEALRECPELLMKQD